MNNQLPLNKWDKGLYKDHKLQNLSKTNLHIHNRNKSQKLLSKECSFLFNIHQSTWNRSSWLAYIHELLRNN